MLRYRPMTPTAVLVATALALAACGSAASPAATEAEPPASLAPSVAASEAATQGAPTDTVGISGSSFGNDITVSVGTTVTFRNNDEFDHTVTEGTGGQAVEGARFNEQVPAGEAIEITFDEAGTVEITCRFHPSMSLVVTVEG